MHIIYIEFGISKSNQYKKVCNLAKQIPNYSCSGGVTQCYIDDVLDYIRLQDTVLNLVDKVSKWKNAKVLLYQQKYRSSADYYEFFEKVKRNAGKYEPLVRSRNESEVSLGAITYEELPLPIVYYPEHYGAFFGFSEDIGKKIYFCECQRQAIENYIKLRRRQPLSNYTGSKTYPLGTDYFPKTIAEISTEHRENPLEPFGFKEKLCFRCNKKIPLMKYCHPNLLSFRMMYITFYHLKFDLDNLDLTSIHYNMPYREPRFRNAMAHYSLFGKLSTTEVIDNVTGFGLFEKFFKESFETVNQALINELTKTRDSLEQYVTI